MEEEKDGGGRREVLAEWDFGLITLVLWVLNSEFGVLYNGGDKSLPEIWLLSESSTENYVNKTKQKKRLILYWIY